MLTTYGVRTQAAAGDSSPANSSAKKLKTGGGHLKNRAEDPLRSGVTLEAFSRVPSSVEQSQQSFDTVPRRRRSGRAAEDLPR